MLQTLLLNSASCGPDPNLCHVLPMEVESWLSRAGLGTDKSALSKKIGNNQVF